MRCGKDIDKPKRAHDVPYCEDRLGCNGMLRGYYEYSSTYAPDEMEWLDQLAAVAASRAESAP
jgi:hypothetical protein